MKKITNQAQLIDAIRTLVDYNWNDEEEDYRENKCEGHIFETLKALDKWITTPL